MIGLMAGAYYLLFVIPAQVAVPCRHGRAFILVFPEVHLQLVH